MTLSTDAYLQQAFNQLRSGADKAISSEAVFVIDGYEEVRLRTKQFPQPTLSSAGEIEIPGPMGIATFQPQQAKINQQGQIAFYESIDGATENFLRAVMATGGKFDAAIYEGTYESYTRGWRIFDCFIQLDNPDRDWENRSQVVMLQGTLFFHYVGDVIPGNVTKLP